VAKYLRIVPGKDSRAGMPGDTYYELPVDADLEEIAEQIGESLADGTSLLIPLDQINGHRAKSAYIVLNGSLTHHVVIGEIADPPATS
jgi:hypothetical protein